MGKFIKEKKVVIILNGRYAGKKAVVIKNFDEGYAALCLSVSVCLLCYFWVCLLRSPSFAFRSPASLLCSSLLLFFFLHSDGQRPYGHALVVGVERAPLKITRKMSQKRQSKRSKIKPFIKVVNYNHIMPTRYSLDVKLDYTKQTVKDAVQKAKARSDAKKKLEERYVLCVSVGVRVRV